MAELALLAALADDDDLLLLSQQNNRESVYKNRFNLDRLTTEQCKQMFRFEKNDIGILRNALLIPEKVVCNNGTVVSGTEGLCLMLRRFAYPNRLQDLEPVFGRPPYEASYIFNKMVNTVYSDHCHLLSNLNQPWLAQQHLGNFATAVNNSGAPLENCWGFVDGTVVPICRPSENQRIVFSGHKRVHALKFQSITTPSGMIANMFGPVEGKRHDAGMLRLSGLLPQLEQYMTQPDGTVFTLYGDAAYPLRTHLITPFKGAALSPDELMFNKRMSSARASIEWTFGKILANFAFVDYKKNQKLYLQPIGMYYIVAGLLTNCHTCLYGCETADYFGVNPSSLQEYLL